MENGKAGEQTGDDQEQKQATGHEEHVGGAGRAAHDSARDDREPGMPGGGDGASSDDEERAEDSDAEAEEPQADDDYADKPPHSDGAHTREEYEQQKRERQERERAEAEQERLNEERRAYDQVNRIIGLGEIKDKDTLYRVLGLEPSSLPTIKQVRAAFRKLSGLMHPDSRIVSGPEVEEAFTRASAAFSYFKNFDGWMNNRINDEPRVPRFAAWAPSDDDADADADGEEPTDAEPDGEPVGDADAGGDEAGDSGDGGPTDPEDPEDSPEPDPAGGGRGGGVPGWLRDARVMARGIYRYGMTEKPAATRGFIAGLGFFTVAEVSNILDWPKGGYNHLTAAVSATVFGGLVYGGSKAKEKYDVMTPDEQRKVKRWAIIGGVATAVTFGVLNYKYGLVGHGHGGGNHHDKVATHGSGSGGGGNAAATVGGHTPGSGGGGNAAAEATFRKIAKANEEAAKLRARQLGFKLTDRQAHELVKKSADNLFGGNKANFARMQGSTSAQKQAMLDNSIRQAAGLV